MNKALRFGVVGTGAVGGYYGGLLARFGYDTHFLLNSDYAHVKEKGLLVASKDGDFHLAPVPAYQQAGDMPLCDVVLLALKTTANHLLPEILPHMTRPDGIVVALQNGLGVEAEIRAVLPRATILGGLCFLCSNKIGPGHIHHLDYGSVRIGEYREDGTAAGITASLDLIASLFKKAGIDVMTTDNLGLARWQKLVWNMAFNGVSVVLNANTAQIMADAAAVDLARDIMTEVIAGANSHGYDLDETFIDVMMSATAEMVDYNPSMKLDFESHRPLEIEAIYERPIMTAQKMGVDMPTAAVIARQLAFLDRRNRHGL